MALGLRHRCHHATRRPAPGHTGFTRGAFIVSLLFLLSAGIATRLFWLQIVHGQEYKRLALNLHGLVKELEPRRGEILLRATSNQSTAPRAIATSRNFFDVYAVPSVMQQNNSTSSLFSVAEQLGALLSVDVPTLEQRFSKLGDPYEPVCEKIDETKAQTVTALNLPGIDLIPHSSRYYPDQNLFSHITGFVGYQDEQKTGLYGLEQYFNQVLGGESGYLSTDQDIAGNPISTSGLNKKDAVDGANLVLTLDYQIQYTACAELRQAVEKYGAVSGNVIVMDPTSGALLALCNYPDFDPNAYNQEKNIGIFINRAISDTYEPGSIFKPLVMAAAMDQGTVTPQTTYEDTGEVTIGQYTIRNSDLKSHGTQTMLGVLEKSLNTGMVFISGRMEHKALRRALEDYGLGKPLGIELPAEASGDISSLSKKGDIYYATASFGQGITVTPLQMVAAFGVLANQGKLTKPYLVNNVIYDSSRQMRTEPKVLHQVISPATAATISGMLVSVVDRGYGNKASVPGYYIAGKTGTAQVPNKDKGGYSDKTVQSFIGFGPISNPRFVMLVKLDEPTNSTFAESSAAPTFKNIAEFILKYYKVPPER